MLSKDEIVKQSKAAYGQWAKQWREHAREHASYPMKSLADFESTGIGRAVLCVGNGFSLEEEIATIRKHQKKVDIMCCDKSLGHLLRNGITPKFCVVADANVSYEYLRPYRDQLANTILIANVCANPEWTAQGNWKDRYFVVMVDVLGSEREFSALSGCPNLVPAATNVSNGLVVALTQSDNRGRKNFFGYDKILLIGFDYSWSPDGGYYAFDQDGGGKRFYMKHVYLMDQQHRRVYSSTNLVFSARWLHHYVTNFKLPVVQCTTRSVFQVGKPGKLDEQMQYSFRPEDAEKTRQLAQTGRMFVQKAKEIERQLKELGKDHHYAFVASVN